MIDFTYQSGDSLLHRLDPAVKFFGLLISSIAVLCCSGLPGLLVSVSLILVLIAISGLEVKTIFVPLKKIFLFLVLVFIMNALFYNEGSCYFSWWIVCISRKGLEQGFNIVLHTFTISVLSFIFIRTTTSIEIMKGMEKLMKPLRLFGIPTRDISLIMSIALQFIPVFFNDLDRIRKAQITRGADFTGGSFKDRVKAVIPLVIPAFVSAFRRADELALAIEARGYRSEKN